MIYLVYIIDPLLEFLLGLALVAIVAAAMGV